jgi:hypothetical protein
MQLRDRKRHLRQTESTSSPVAGRDRDQSSNKVDQCRRLLVEQDGNHDDSAAERICEERHLQLTESTSSPVAGRDREQSSNKVNQRRRNSRNRIAITISVDAE